MFYHHALVLVPSNGMDKFKFKNHIQLYYHAMIAILMVCFFYYEHCRAFIRMQCACLKKG